ncbi:hypothetical protein MmiAt1_01560 [Methanimicrococcus sp. At1]|uniref:Type II toxin-antitoxin system RelE/ParE family toxin n=1 Tax=Methanimicrococcus hacksteinii TaxID=3028293 RepID=A0ABU3VMR6_9EURY|nr:type II toxin-antitoxin system RelE/ParE family toxin [Methanimicrococcus sp. At1]MDV0444624.1 hypothetical protein [Methanimicrococcus sp. At1]
MAEIKYYKIKILPLFEKDLTESLNYITYELQNPAAATLLLEEVQKAISERLFVPASFEAYFPPNSTEPHYRIYVRNYLIFYTVVDDTVRLRRFVYNRRNIEQLLQISDI